jgi:hypothetical protein
MLNREALINVQSINCNIMINKNKSNILGLLIVVKSNKKNILVF